MELAAYPKIHTLSRWRQWQYSVKAALPGVMMGLLLVGGVIYCYVIAPNSEMADVKGAVTRHSAGVVSSVTYLAMTKGNTNPSIVAFVDINGDETAFRTHAPLQKNEHVQVTYRTGKSGRIHIDDIEPNGGTKP